MANSDKDIVITPNRGSSSEDPKIVFSGADASTGAQTITLKAYPTNGGTISFEGSTGQLLSIANTMAGTIFSANDISGVPSIEVLDSGIIRLAPYSGQVAAGGTTVIGAAKLSVINGGSSSVSWNTGFSMGSAANYTTWIQDASVSRFRNQGGGGMDWYNGAGDTRILYLTNSGDLQAKRFVDIDNTSYYVDPAGTSVLNNLSVSGSITQWSLGPERQYSLGNITASATQARRVEVARVFIDYNDWHSAGTIFVELQNSYYYGGDWQKWAISYDYNVINCDLIEGNSPRGRSARVTTSSPVQISGDYYYISIYVDVRYYAQYYAYLRTSWPASSSPTASGQSGTIYVYSDPATTPGYTNISDFTPNYTVYTTNILATSDKMRADSFEEYGNSAYYIDPAGSSNIGRLIVNSSDGNGAVYVTSGGHAYVTVNRSAAANGEVGIRLNTADSTRWWNYLATSDNNTLRWYSAAGADKMTLTQAGSLVAYSDMQAPAFYHKDNTGYYLKPASSTDALLINGHMKQGTLVARPYAYWGATAGTGQVLIKLPGNINNYGMIHAVIDVYEYNSNASCTITVGGHNWSGAWYNYNSDVVGFTDKQVRLGFHGGQYTIAIGSNGSSWSYGQVVLRKIQTGAYYTGIMDLSGTYTVTLDSNAEAGFSWVSGDLRQLRTPSTITASGYIYAPRFVDSDNNSYYVDPYSGSVLNGSITKNGFTMPFVALQDAAPTAQQAGDFWWESDTGRLKVRYTSGATSQWVDASPSPDVTIYLPKAGGGVTGPLVSSSYFIASGYIQTDTAIRSERYVDTSNTFVYRVGNGSGRTRHLNLADTTSDPSGTIGATGITWGQRSDNNPYYMIYTKDPYSNGYSTHSRLVLAWHTGIEIGAEQAYGGTRFFNNSPFTGTEIFSVGKGDSNVRVVNNIYAGIYYDNDTTYYLNANADRDSNINGFTTRTQAMLGLTYKYNYFRPVSSPSDSNYWVGSMGWGSYNFGTEIFHWGSGFIDSWGSTGAQDRPGDTSHHVGVQALHYTNTTYAYGWQMVGGPTDNLWWRHRWGTSYSSWWNIAMYGNNSGAGDLYATRHYASDATSWYVDPNDISNMYLIQGKLYTSSADYTGSDNATVRTWSGVLCAGSDYSGANTYTYIRTKILRSSYSMGGFTIDWFENYSSTNAKTTITLGGYWNQDTNGGPIGWEYTSTNPNIRPTIHVGFDDNNYYMIRLTHFNSNYAVIVCRDLWLGYSGTSPEQGDTSNQMGSGWKLQQASTLNFLYVTAVQPRLAVAMDTISYMTASIGRADHAQGYLVGGYNSVGASESYLSPIYTIGTSYMPSSTSLGNWYGIGFGVGGTYGSAGAMAGGWGLAVVTAGSPSIFLSGGTGTIVSSGYHAGDVFYQYNNTSYYFNPDATVSLNAYGRVIAGVGRQGGSYGGMTSSGFNANALGSANASYTGGGCGHPPWGGSPSFGAFINVNGAGLGALWSGNSVNYPGGEPGGVYYGGEGSYTSGGGAGLYAQGGDGGYYAMAGAGIYARGGTNGYWFGVSAYGITRAPAAYFDGNVYIMTPSGSTQCGLNIGYFEYTSNSNSTYLLRTAGPGYFSSYVDTDYARKSGDTGWYWNLNSSSNVSTVVTGAMYFRSNRNTTSDSPPLQAYSNDAGGAIMSFHRGGYYAVNFGLDSDNVIRIGGWSASTNRLQMDMSGNLTMAGNVTAYSDIRLKENIEVITDALNKVKQIRGVTFTRNDAEDKEQRHAGVIAQEVEIVLPEVVAEDNSGVKNVAYGNMVGLLIEAIKEQQQIIDSQEDRLARLEALVKGVA